MARAPIGIFDSGVGGLTVAAAIRQALPAERLLYFGDAAHIPYGDRSLREVRGFTAAIVRAMIGQGCKLIVIACNTASAAALHHVREAYPNIPFVGMEPAVKPAAARSRTNVVGVIATRATFQSELFESVIERFAQGVRVIAQPCPGLVQAIEAGELDTPNTEHMLRSWLEPMLEQGIDELVLACTHYPLVRPLIERIVGPGVEVIDPAPAVARQTHRLLVERNLLAMAGEGSFKAITSGDAQHMLPILRMLHLPTDQIGTAVWERGKVVFPRP